MDTYVGINGTGIRSRNNAIYSMVMCVIPLLDYTPGAAGTNGTTTKGANPITYLVQAPSAATYMWTLAGTSNNTQYPDNTPLNVRFCITGHNVSLVIRFPNYYNEKGGYLFFGLPDILSKEKNSGATTVTGSCNGTSANSTFFIADTPLNIPSTTSGYDVLTSYGFTPPKSPDANGNFPFMLAYGGDTSSGLRIRHPSAFFVRLGGLLDGDLITVDGMTFEIIEPQFPMSGNFLSGYVAYRIA